MLEICVQTIIMFFKNSSSKAKKQKSYLFGIFAEYYVIFLFFFKGYILLKHRYKTKMGEIDLIFKNKDNLIAVEVKARKDTNTNIGEVVSFKQYKRIMNSLKLFLNKNIEYSNFNTRIDVVLVKGLFNIQHLKNVWME